MYNKYDEGDSQTYYDYYTIKRGDNLYQIGKTYNVNPALIAILNGLNLNDYIYPIFMDNDCLFARTLEQIVIWII